MNMHNQCCLNLSNYSTQQQKQELPMKFECDPGKNESNIVKHGIGLLQAIAMFPPASDAMLVIEDLRNAYPEPRFRGYNDISSRLMVVVFCQPEPHIMRIISLRKANDREQKMVDAIRWRTQTRH
ncbi:BrnT family toxin [Amphibiibacter pelophylacis]|uniref:BrnT family toxin n=1 Tax=Amphibiibacter pelophylacis TaxID=1799477 RepID=A0ACC6P0M6_9BURK